MKITKRRLRRIIRESLEGITPDQVSQFLSDNAKTYHMDRSLTPPDIEMLLQDDFLDDVGHEVSIADYEDLIARLSHDPNAYKGQPRM